jgi:hypothetical protein
MSNLPVTEDWDIIRGMLPEGWEKAAIELGAMQRARGVASPEVLLRLILLHVAGGLSLRQTTARAKVLGWAQLSDVALLKRLRASERWLQEVCVAMTHRHIGEIATLPQKFQSRRFRIIDGTTVQEPGAKSSSWRIHFSLTLPAMSCDFFEVTDAKGAETLRRFQFQRGDLVLADRGYCHREPVGELVCSGAEFVLRHSSQLFPLLSRSGREFSPLKEIDRRKRRPQEYEVSFKAGTARFDCRLCVIKKSSLATERSQRKIRRKHACNGYSVSEEVLESAGYVFVLTNLPAKEFSAQDALELYRLRWQVELVFKRLKGLFALGCLPKYDPDSCRAWLQAKMLCALLVDELMREARFFSPWGWGL